MYVKMLQGSALSSCTGFYGEDSQMIFFEEFSLNPFGLLDYEFYCMVQSEYII